MHNAFSIRTLAVCLALFLQVGAVDSTIVEKVGFQTAPVIYAQLVVPSRSLTAPPTAWQSRISNAARLKSLDATLSELSLTAAARSDGYVVQTSSEPRPASGEARVVCGRSPPGVQMSLRS
jgi:hypothetical protein